MTDRHTPEQAAEAAAEALRQLNHRLSTIEMAAEVYDVVGALSTCLERMQQALRGTEDWLIRERQAGRLRLTSVGDLDLRVRGVGSTLGIVRDHCQAAAGNLRMAQRWLADVYGPVVKEDEG